MIEDLQIGNRNAVHDVLLLRDPDQAAEWKPIKQRHQIFRRHVNAAVRLRTPQSGFITETVDVNVAAVGIDIAATIEAWFQTFQPQDAMHNRSRSMALPGKPGDAPAAKDRSDGLAGADL